MKGLDVLSAIEKLEPEDREKVAYFVEILLFQEKYRALREELEERRREIKEGKVLTHEEVWSKLGV